MTGVIELEKARLDMAVRKGYRNWKSQFNEDFGPDTKASDLSTKTLVLLARGKEKSTFYLFDLIMNLQTLGSGFEFDDLGSRAKMAVMDRYLFLLDQIRFEYMKRLGWLERYPGEALSLVELVIRFDELAPRLQADKPLLRKDHDAYEAFSSMNDLEKEEFIRKMIAKALKGIQSVTR
ncbi:MAG: hypothetical protein P8175_13530 [Deltaproteobacteria bacterium]